MARLLLILVCMLGFASSARAGAIQEVTSPGGIKAWLIVDRKLPIIAVNIAFRGGVEQDPVDKQGLADLTMNALTQGAGLYDAREFQKQLADNSIAMSFEAGRDEVTGRMKFLSADRGKAFELLRLALTHPRFGGKDIQLLKAAQLSAVRQQFASPSWQARYRLMQKIFPNHPYNERHLGTAATLANIKDSDIRRFADDHFARDNLIVSVAGDIGPKQLAAELDNVFGTLPKHARLTKIADAAWPEESETILTSRGGTQTELLFAMPGPKRDDPDWYAAEIANYIIGGGGFSSRLMQNVRDKKGLTYGIGTDLAPMDHAAMIVGEAAADNPKAAEAWSIARDTMQDFYSDGATQKEVDAAKSFLTGSLALAMTSRDKIAAVLTGMQVENLGIDYLDRRGERLRKVTLEDVNRAIRRWFDPDRITLSMAGKPNGLKPAQTYAPVRE